MHFQKTQHEYGYHRGALLLSELKVSVGVLCATPVLGSRW